MSTSNLILYIPGDEPMPWW